MPLCKCVDCWPVQNSGLQNSIACVDPRRYGLIIFHNATEPIFQGHRLQVVWNASLRSHQRASVKPIPSRVKTNILHIQNSSSFQSRVVKGKIPCDIFEAPPTIHNKMRKCAVHRGKNVDVVYYISFTISCNPASDNRHASPSIMAFLSHSANHIGRRCRQRSW